jgi:hypothetical protein
MQPDKLEREALWRKPVSPDYQRYERMKAYWLDTHPRATPAEYEAAIRQFAKICGCFES